MLCLHSAILVNTRDYLVSDFLMHSKEGFDYTEGVIRSRKPMKEIQHKDLKEHDQNNNGLNIGQHENY